MNFDIHKSLEILQRTPLVIETLLCGVSEEWVRSNEGENTWSPYDVLGHLIHGERTDWISRTKIILSDSPQKQFQPFDRFAQLNTDQNRPIQELLEEFKALRAQSLNELMAFQLNDDMLAKKGIHPEFGDVTLKELLSTWVVHDLGHIAQIARVMAKQYKSEVGPWTAYLGILK